MPPKLTSGSDDPVEIKFGFQASQKRGLRYVNRKGGTYLELRAPQCLEIGGQRSGKTVGKLMFGIQNYCLRFTKCDILVLRRTFPELDAGVIQDFKTFVPKALYDFNASTRVVTFKNGSRVVFAGCANDVERDIEKYLGQAYPFILVDECSQFSSDVWERLYARNLVNAACEEDEFGNLPTPGIVGCTNPIGAHWTYYHTVFVLKEPWLREEGIRRANDGSWWVPDADSLRCVYVPSHYFFNHTTVLDNDAYLKRDPGIIQRLKALPKAKMQKFLLGLMDKVDGQYFDCWTEEHHVIDLREDPERIIWQDWQPVWVGHDWGVGHHSAAYLFTKALVRTQFGNDYKLKVVCFAEVAPETTGHTNIELADMLKARAHYPRLPESSPQFERISGRACKVNAIYFSHEKFNRVMEAHSPADEYSRLLRDRGLPSVSRCSRDRIGRATLMYNLLKTGNLVVLRQCSGITIAIPALQRDPDELDDVLKVDNKADDRYDAFSYGLFGQLGQRATPGEEAIKDYVKTLDPFNAHFYALKKRSQQTDAKQEFKQKEVPYWQTK